MKFKLRHMEVFRAVMLTGSTSAAARMLFVSQPVVSRTLANIETSLGLPLFERKVGALLPTENARVIFREVDDLYSAAARIDGLVENLKGHRQERISFSSSPALGLRVVPKAIKHYLATQPPAAFSYKTSLIKEMPADLLGKVVDFALSIWPIDHPNLRCIPLFDGKICLAVPKGHPLSQRRLIKLEDLTGLPLILYQQEMPIGALIRERLRAAGVEDAPLVEINRSEQACALVHEGVGVALINELCVDEELWSGLVARPVDLDFPVAVYLITSAFETLQSGCETFLQMLVRQQVEALNTR
ncbi:LysR substrate-binding domain-containing protein [Bordetella holmesii]|uniref:LysR substrate-binding domain protein n=3 Tax=Bordetella holmesii TaxID=35814 RepID=A0A158M473_9BORD|nr:LysR substrate-binding domain-containing protein [Bordetella holmesii]AHV91799.1 bacterial regulatory helix-turn-helix, lysR family protein [Bordetella holmesii ATCC 51541]AIT26328.1 bacterial regulatory helix-turn-helix, lysR family protein [Bordetella holmesii 44057]EWM43420.1 bacterial regulatory helix-turn-helix, lysR family protein [Bordetella holmesii 41130]EWM46901.1 bacterial regulatory helix-turn-helix, lysR family protein [Bordetella holmesii 35009]EWM51076.1 bacterial regulatory 